MVRSDYVIKNNIFLSDERETSIDEMRIFGKNTRRNRNSKNQNIFMSSVSLKKAFRNKLLFLFSLKHLLCVVRYYCPKSYYCQALPQS